MVNSVQFNFVPLRKFDKDVNVVRRPFSPKVLDFTSQSEALQLAKANYNRACISFTGASPFRTRENRLAKMMTSVRDSFEDKEIPQSLDGILFGKHKLKKYILDNVINPKEFIREIAHRSRVVMLGEYHEQAESKKFATDMLKTFKDNGYTHVAVEIDSRYQGDVDEFMSGKLSIKILNKRLKTILPSHMQDYCEGPTLLESSCSGHFMKECKKQGLKVVCVDDMEKYMERKFDFDYIDGLNPVEYVEEGYSRDSLIFNNLKSSVLDKEPQAKVLVYIGAAHVQKAPIGNSENVSLRMLLDRHFGEDKIASIELTDPENINTFVKMRGLPVNAAFSTQSHLLDSIVKEGIDNKPDFEPGYAYYNRHIDGIVLLENQTPWSFA